MISCGFSLECIARIRLPKVRTVNLAYSGNISGHKLACAGVLDCLSSDYMPSILLHATLLLSRDAGWTLQRAVASVSAMPAALATLPDRGEIRTGLRADVIRVQESLGIPVVHEVLRKGRWILQCKRPR